MIFKKKPFTAKAPGRTWRAGVSWMFNLALLLCTQLAELNRPVTGDRNAQGAQQPGKSPWVFVSSPFPSPIFRRATNRSAIRLTCAEPSSRRSAKWSDAKLKSNGNWSPRHRGWTW